MLHKGIQFPTAQNIQYVYIYIYKYVLWKLFSEWGTACTSLHCSADWFCSSTGRCRIPLTVLVIGICPFKVQNGVRYMIYALIFPISYWLQSSIPKYHCIHTNVSLHYTCSTQPTTSGPHHTQVQDPTSIYNCKHHHRCSEIISEFFLLLWHHLLNVSISSRNTLTAYDIILLNKNEQLEDSWFHFSAYPPGRCQQYSINCSKSGQCYKHRYDPSHVAIQAVGKCLWRQQNNSEYAAL